VNNARASNDTDLPPTGGKNGIDFLASVLAMSARPGAGCGPALEF